MLKLHLIEQAAAALSAVAVLFAAQLGDLQIEMDDQGFGGANLRLNLGQTRVGYYRAFGNSALSASMPFGRGEKAVSMAMMESRIAPVLKEKIAQETGANANRSGTFGAPEVLGVTQIAPPSATPCHPMPMAR